METPMRIGELGQATGVDIETIRYYEKAGLLPAPARSRNGYRAYGAAHLERLAPKDPPEGTYRYWHNRYLDFDGRLGFNAGDHLKSILSGFECFLPVEGGKTIRGTRQRVYFVEYDGPLARTVFIQLLDE